MWKRKICCYFNSLLIDSIKIELPEEETSTFAHTCQAANQLIRLRIDHLTRNKDEADDQAGRKTRPIHSLPKSIAHLPTDVLFADMQSAYDENLSKIRCQAN
ncbi:Inactive rhomboid protein [Trichinella pseudospiralis]